MLPQCQYIEHLSQVKKEYLAIMKQPRVSRKIVKPPPKTSPDAVELKLESEEVKRLEAIEKELHRDICHLNDQMFPKLFT